MKALIEAIERFKADYPGVMLTGEHQNGNTYLISATPKAEDSPMDWKAVTETFLSHLSLQDLPSVRIIIAQSNVLEMASAIAQKYGFALMPTEELFSYQLFSLDDTLPLPALEGEDFGDD